MVFKAIWKPLALTSLVALSLWGLSARRYSAGKEAGKLAAADADHSVDIAGGLRTSIAQLRCQLAGSENWSQCGKHCKIKWGH